MKTITRTVVTVDLNSHVLREGQVTIHEALLDGDEELRVGSKAAGALLTVQGYVINRVAGIPYPVWRTPGAPHT